MLKKVDAQAKLELMRKIDNLSSKVSDIKQREFEDKLREKYKYVKFVERKKIIKKLKKATDPETIKLLNDQVSSQCL